MAGVNIESGFTTVDECDTDCSHVAGQVWAMIILSCIVQLMNVVMESTSTLWGQAFSRCVGMKGQDIGSTLPLH